jgi:hypothetical protein
VGRKQCSPRGAEITGPRQLHETRGAAKKLFGPPKKSGLEFERPGHKPVSSGRGRTATLTKKEVERNSQKKRKKNEVER